MALNRISGRFLVVFAAICTVGGFMAGSSRSQTGKAEPASEVGRYQFSVGQSIESKLETNNYVVFDTKTARAWELQTTVNVDGDSDLHWYAIPSPFDPVQKIVNFPAAKSDEKPDAN